jgi:DNA replication protein DnaC
MSTNETQLVNTMVCEKHNIQMALIKNNEINFSYYECPECLKEDNKKNEEMNAEKEAKRLLSGIPEIFYGARIEKIEGIKVVVEWLKKKDGFLFIHGPCGCGKTHLACAIKYSENAMKCPCDLVFSSELFLKLRSSFNRRDIYEDEIIEEYSSCRGDDTKKRLVIFDDMGVQKISDYVIESWYNIINRRYMNNLPTIFTSNLSLKEISLTMTDRIASRLASGIVYEMQGNDRRLIK